MPDQRPRPGSRARAPTLATRPTGRIGRVHIPNAGTSEGTRTWNYGRLADGGRGARFILMGHGVHDVVEDDADRNWPRAYTERGYFRRNSNMELWAPRGWREGRPVHPNGSWRT